MKVSETSMDAYKSLHPKRLQAMYDSIIKALKKIKTGSYEQIADEIGCDRSDVGRRLKEMETLFMVIKTGNKVQTKRGRAAFEYTLANEATASEKKEFNQFWKDYQSGKLETPETRMFIQQNLFQ